MTRLSVNINKLATLRNARGGNNPDLKDWTKKIQNYGAQGITVHPRPDERHIRYNDVKELRPLITTEFNIEGYPNDRFIDLVLAVKPDQVTLVPDPPDVITSNKGWEIAANLDLLKITLRKFKEAGVRTSLFMDPDLDEIKQVKSTGADRIELYTESYASLHAKGEKNVTEHYRIAAKYACEEGLGVNAGHDLDLSNLRYFVKKIPNVLEVSIGHALICDALLYGMENTVQLYLRELAEI